MATKRLLRQKLVQEVGYCCNRPDQGDFWKNVEDFGTFLRKGKWLNGVSGT